jgi:dGTPase
LDHARIRACEGERKGGGRVSVITRLDIEAAEHATLCDRAAFSDGTRGRQRPMEPDLYRTEYQRDRDRIIHSKAFRRLMHKTQVFLSPEGDHYRTRLTHTLEVAQIARSVARALRLNEDLTEAIALGHDLGHTPFGHVGEDAISECYDEIRARYPQLPDRYHHNVQSLRVVEHLEYEGKGLNLTWEVRDGILNHTGEGIPATLEGGIVRLADRIAYVNHDIDDAVRGGVLDPADLPAGPVAVLGSSHGARIRTMVRDTIAASDESDVVRMSPEVWDAMMGLRAFLFEHVYLSKRAKEEEPKSDGVVKALFRYYFEHPDTLPEEFHPEDPAELPQRVTDYIAGMTDRYAIGRYEELFVPSSWRM